MAQKFTVPITIKQLASAGSDALTVFVNGEVYGRVKIEAGGRLSWSDGTGVYDTNLYRDGANTLATDDIFKALTALVSPTTNGAPSVSVPDGAIAVDNTNNRLYFRSNSTWRVVEGGATVSATAPSNPLEGALWFDTSDDTLYIRQGSAWVVAGGGGASVEVGATAPSSPSEGDMWWDSNLLELFIYYSSAWVQVTPSSEYFDLADLGDVSSTPPTNGQVLVFNNSTGEYEPTTLSTSSSLDGLTDTTLTSPTSGEFLKYNGSAWVNDAIDLGTDTTGNYVSDVSGGTGVTVTHTPGEGSTPSVAIGQDVGTTADVTFNTVTADLTGNADTATALQTSRTIELTGDVTGSASFDGTANATLSVTISSDSVALGTDTTGDYVQNLVAGTGVTLGANSGEGATPSIAIGQDVGTTADVTFNTVTADLTGDVTGNADTATSLETARTISLGGDLSGSASFNGTADVTITATVQPDSIALGTDTTGNYMSGVTAGTGISVTHTPGEGSNATIALDADLSSLGDITVTSPEQYQTLVYDGSEFINEYPTTVSNVQNAETTTLTVGTVVYLFGGTGDRASVKRADNSSDTTSSKTVGVVASSINSSANGPVVTRGYVNGINLSSGYAAGDILWLGSNGQFTATKPSTPDHLVFVGVVVRATNNGIVYVATQNGYELEELHDVKVSSLANKDVLVWNSASAVWVNGQINLGTDTVGDYVQNLVAGTGVTITDNSGEGTTPTVAIGQDVSTSASVLFAEVETTGDFTVGGDLFVTGTLTTVNETNLAIEDTFIYLNDGSTVTNPDLGIVGNYNDGTYAHSGVFRDATDGKWKFFDSYTPEPTDPINTGHASYAPAPVVAETFESTVSTGTAPFTVSSTTEVTNLHADTASSLHTARNISLGGDIAGSASFDGSGDVTITATVQANSVALGTDTTGNYMVDIAEGTGVTITHTPGEASTGTIAIGQDVGTTADVTFNTVTADVTGDLTGNVTGNADTATTLQTSRTISLGGDLSGSASFNGSADVTITATIGADSVALGTDTTGNYVQNLVAGTGITLTNNTGEGATPTVAVTANTYEAFGAVATHESDTTNIHGITDTAALVTLAGTQTLTNKTLTSPVITGVSPQITLAGDLTGSVTLTDLGNGTLTATIAANSVALGTDTTGNYVNDVTAGTGVTVTHTPGEGSSPTIAIGQAVGTTSDVTFNTVTADLTGDVTGNADTATTLAAARTISLGGDLSGSASFNGSSDVTITATIGADSVTLGTDTTGNYVNDVTAGTGVTVTHTPGEGSSPTVAIGQAVATSDSPTFAGATLDAVQIGITAAGEIDTSSGNLTIDSAGGTVTVDDNLIVSGDLTVSGTTTTVNTETINLADNIITLNSNETGTPSQNAGLEVERGTSTNVQLRWNETSDKWELSEDGSNYYDIATEAYVDGQTITSLDDVGDVTITSATSGDFLKWNGTAWVNDPVNLGTDTTGDYVGSLVAGTGVTLTNNSGEGATPTVAIGQAVGTTDNVTFNSVTASLTGNADTATTLATSRTIALGGDLSGSASFDGSANITITATIGADSVALGTDTTGNYMEDVSAGTGISVTHTPSEGSTATVALNATLDNLSNVNAPAPSDGQFLKYVSASSEWQPAAIPTINNLDDVGDVNITSATSGDFLKWNGSAWVNDPVNLGTDTTGDYVQSLVAGTGISLANNSGEGATPTVTLNAAIDDLSDVSAAAPTSGDVLSWNGSAWVSSAPSSGASLTVSATAPSSPSEGDMWFESDTGRTYVYYDSAWVEIGAISAGSRVSISANAPSNPTAGDTWFDSDTAQTFIYYDSQWIEIGASAMAATIAGTAPSNAIGGQIWFDSNTGGTYVYFNSTWVEVGASALDTLLNTIEAKGDILVGTADNAVDNLTVGSNGQILVADSAEATGLKWETPNYASTGKAIAMAIVFGG